MKKYSGFTLIEVMIALACMVGIVSATVSFSMALYRSWKETAQAVQVRMSLHAALDTVRRDLEHAPQACAQWQKTGPHELAWKDAFSAQSLRICLVQGRLERCEGFYDKRTQQWHTRSASVLAYDIKELRCVVHKSRLLSGMSHESFSHGNAPHGSTSHDSTSYGSFSLGSFSLGSVSGGPVTQERYNAVDVVVLTQCGYEERVLIALGVGALS